MNSAKLKHYIHKTIRLGPKKTASVLINRFKTSVFQSYIRHKALQKKADHTWFAIANKHRISSEFSSFFNQLKNKDMSFIKTLGLSDSVDMQQADRFANNCFDLLGSGKQCFKQLPWHIDFRLQQQEKPNEVDFDSETFYQDIDVNLGHNENLGKDIKIPWELSRFQHLAMLGTAYAQSKDETYVNPFVHHISDWLDANCYLLGPNWKCPMDVGIRAINWIISFCFFKYAVDDEAFWQRFACSLYDHMIYLENSWEIYDSITSNHYLSDLIGYFYLCYFFSDLPGVEEKTNWCYQELLKEFDKQVFDEGADYEGSTHYHKLVTEIFYHFSCLAEHMGFCVPNLFKQKLSRMFGFIDWCTPCNGTLIQIGDNDSGKIVAGISSALIDGMKEKLDNRQKVASFPPFGLSVIKTNDWHISLRSHAYEQKQPTGHFHNDIGSITVNVRGVDLFSDPGSYVYTPSKVWRNRFRSVNVHNTFFLEDIEPIALDDRLFYMALDETESQISHSIDNGIVQLTTHHDLYFNFGLRVQRSVTFDELKSTMVLQDRWQQINAKKLRENLVSCWNFTLGPTIRAEKTGNGLMLLHKNKSIAEITSQLNFDVYDGWYSPSYGTKLPCKSLKAKSALSFEESMIVVTLAR